MNFKKKKMGGEDGFTLIELLVVIAIIAILSTVVMAGLNSARQKGRDANRVASIRNVQAALELFNDTCGGYPESTGATAVAMNGTNQVTLSAANAAVVFASNCATPMTTYLATAPTNPTPTATGFPDYKYCPTAGGVANPPLCVATSAGPKAGYGISFGLEGISGTLGAGVHYATPSGVQ